MNLKKETNVQIFVFYATDLLNGLVWNHSAKGRPRVNATEGSRGRHNEAPATVQKKGTAKPVPQQT